MVKKKDKKCSGNSGKVWEEWRDKSCKNYWFRTYDVDKLDEGSGKKSCVDLNLAPDFSLHSGKIYLLCLMVLYLFFNPI